ncbi:unnamed protein product, partial [Mycena citricolor]
MCSTLSLGFLPAHRPIVSSEARAGGFPQWAISLPKELQTKLYATMNVDRYSVCGNGRASRWLMCLHLPTSGMCLALLPLRKLPCASSTSISTSSPCFSAYQGPYRNAC